MYYINGRYYEDEVGQFITPDYSSINPLVIGGLNPYGLGVSNPLMFGVNPDNYFSALSLYSDIPTPGSSGPNWLSWILSGVQFIAGAGLCFVPGAQGLGISLLVSGGLGLASNTMVESGVDSKTASLISSGANIAIGIAFLFSPIAPVGASMIGASLGSIGGGFLSQSLGGNFMTGSTIGGFVGGIVGGKVYDRIVFSRIAKRGIYIGRKGYIDVADELGLDHYDGMPGYKLIEKISPKAAAKLGWAHNYRYISNVMKYKGIIKTTEGIEIAGTYAKELALIGNYKNLVWLPKKP